MPTILSRFRIDWVLVNELAIGPAPRTVRHLDQLKEQGIGALLSVCAEEESPCPEGLEHRFVFQRFVLPDHRYDRSLDLTELQRALELLEQLQSAGPVFVHCVASIERSPLVCLAWLVKRHELTPQRALDYLMQVHPGTNPLAEQIRLLKSL